MNACLLVVSFSMAFSVLVLEPVGVFEAGFASYSSAYANSIHAKTKTRARNTGRASGASRPPDQPKSETEETREQREYPTQWQ